MPAKTVSYVGAIGRDPIKGDWYAAKVGPGFALMVRAWPPGWFGRCADRHSSKVGPARVACGPGSRPPSARAGRR
jgi:hypothetical protein